MKIWASNYTLKSRDWLSAKAQSQERHGALLKIEDALGAVGYADLHPWTELGDLRLDLQLKALAEGGDTPLTRRSKVLAQMDRESRRLGVNAFKGLTIPESHCLIPSFENLSDDRLDEISNLGFRTLKFKVGTNWPQFIAFSLSRKDKLKHFQLRLDFNGSLSAEEFLKFSRTLDPEIGKQVEFIEDPVPWSFDVWQSLQKLPLALDRLEPETKEAALAPYLSKQQFLSWLVLKPAVQNPEVICSLANRIGARVAVTSYLDHPVGQMGAALCAARLVKSEYQENANFQLIGTCGLVSHTAFENNQFSELLPGIGPKLKPPDGTGIGFDFLLEKQKWIKVL